jgi:hypothetical protein
MSLKYYRIRQKNKDIEHSTYYKKLVLTEDSQAQRRHFFARRKIITSEGM